ncbi:MAG TPA: hypothetical protein DCQ31_11440 [Bacteroidales bacterium]|nr:hypothetical protein [Bacteroidales bacterium]
MIHELCHLIYHNHNNPSTKSIATATGLGKEEGEVGILLFL